MMPSTQFFRHFCLLAYITISCPVISQNIYVSPSGNDSNPGSLNSPKRTIQAASNQLKSGDTLFLRVGSYHEEVVLESIRGSESNPVVIKAFADEHPIVDGTVDLEDLKSPGASWELASDAFPGTNNIYRLQLEEDIWQLFVGQPELMHAPNAVGAELAGFRMQVIARWPNSRTNPCDPLRRQAVSTEAAVNTWWSFKTTWAFASSPETNFTTIKNVPTRFNLAGTGKSFQGGTAILSIIKQGPANIPVNILDHKAGSDLFTHSGISPSNDMYNYPSDHGPSFIVQHLQALDAPGEWYFDADTKTAYLWPEDNSDPNGKTIRGKTQTYAFDLHDCEYIEFNGLGLFATSLRLDGDHISFVNGAISYPDMPKTLLGVYGNEVPAIDARQCWNFTLRNCIVEYSQYHIIEVKNVGGVFENNYLHHLGMTGLGTTGCIMNANTFRYNTLETIGHRAAVKCNSSPESGRIQSWNILDGWGYLYSNDGVGFQTSQGGSVNSVRAYNWFLKSDKPGHRYDGPEEGKGFPTLGLSHHLVGLRTKSVSTNIKGDYNQAYNYLGIESTSEHGSIAIRWNLETGEGNRNSILQNCAADGINIGKWHPLPCINSHNWDASKKGGNMLVFHPGADLLDFRPEADAPLVNAGTEVPGITDGYLGSAPDIGAYEWGDDTYWIPGYRSPSSSLPIPFDGAKGMPLDRDLIFRHAYQSDRAMVYFGVSHDAVLNATQADAKQPGSADLDAGEVVKILLDSGRNIVTPTMLQGNPKGYDPSPYLLVDDPHTVLSTNTTYYWRAAAVSKHGEISKGTVWSFSTGEQTHLVQFKTYGNKEGVVTPAVEVTVELTNGICTSDNAGSTYGARLSPDLYAYKMHKRGFQSAAGSFLLQSDTLITDTLEYENYQVSIEILDADTEEPIQNAAVAFGDMGAVVDQNGVVQFPGIDYGFYQISATADGFLPSEAVEVEMFSDTTFQFYLTRDYHTGHFTITDDVTDVPVYRALMSTDLGDAGLTNSAGEVRLGKLAPGWWDFLIEHDDYFSHTDSLWITGDTTAIIKLAKKSANVTLMISDPDGPLQDAAISLGALKGTSNYDGMAWFFFLPAREAYHYTVRTEGYEPVDDTIYLKKDTTIQIMMQALTGTGSTNSANLRIYPNPATEKLNIEFSRGEAEVRLCHSDGRIIALGKMVNGQYDFDLTGMAPGFYCVRLIGKSGSKTGRIVKY